MNNPMITRNYELRFLTPAFLGNAHQSGQWRTPPFKAQLRQWWRVAVAQELNFNVDALRNREAELFGVAADGGDSHKSRVRIRLNHWDEGKLRTWESTESIRHPEVQNPVGSDLYLGFGPLSYNKKSRVTALKSNAAIQSGERATFSIAVSERYINEMGIALWLMDRFGTIGGRSRNGWGSFSLTLADENKAALDGSLPLRDWEKTLELDWPHALGSDNHPLIWGTEDFDNWTGVMTRLAEIKIGLRTAFTFETGNKAPNPEKRHWLSYPVTNHSVNDWGHNARLPNSLRFKVRQSADGKFHGVIFHVPCKPPAPFKPVTKTLKEVWQQAYNYLDAFAGINRITE